MALKYLVDLDLSGSEIQNFALQALATAPTALSIGHVYFNTATNEVMVSTDGTTFATVGGNVQSDWTATTGDAFIQNKPTLGTLAALSAVDAATITDDSVGAAELNVSGNGAAGQVLTSDEDGTFSWTDKTVNTDVDVSLENLTARLADLESVTIGNTAGTVSIAGNLNVAGTTTTVNTETINLADNIITLNSNAVDDTENAGIEVYNGGGAESVFLRYNNAPSRKNWEFTNDGTTYHPILLKAAYTANEGTVTSVAVTGAGGITVASGSPVTTSGTIALTINDDAITNAKLANDAITINGTSVALGGSINVGDITGVTAGLGLSGGGTSGDVTVNNGFNHIEATISGDGPVSIDLNALGLQAYGATIQVYETPDGGVTRNLVLTAISITDNATAVIELAGRDYVIHASGLRA